MKKFLFILLLPILTLGSPTDSIEVIIHLKTDSYPSENRWILYDSAYQGPVIAEVQYGHYSTPNVMNYDTIYIGDTSINISFVIYDSYGDGIINGEYYVTVCGDTIVDYPVSTFTTGLIHNRPVPQCLPNPPPPGPCVPTLIQINTDQYPDETSWRIEDTLGNTMFFNGPYTNAPDYQPQSHIICLPIGEFVFVIEDQYGDGMAGSLWGGQDGSYYVIQCGDTLVYGTDANFGNDSSHVIISDTCTPPPPIYGCTDDNYLEYNPIATVSDSSCITLKIIGCIDSTAFNYDSTANYMDYVDSCSFNLTLHDLAGNGWVGSRLEVYQDDTTEHVLLSGFNQTTSIVLNAPEQVKFKFFINQQASMTALECGFTLTNPFGDTVISIQPPFIQPFFVYTAQTYCGDECIEKVYGCLDSTAWNYDSLANVNETCYYYPGCTSPAYLEYHVDTANNYISDVMVQDSCQTLAMFGCTDTTAFNYDSLANIDNGGCIPVILGCMQPLAFNYNANANVDDGSCIPFVYGCTDPTMFNYNSNANTDDGSCIPYTYGCTDSTALNYNVLANADNGSCIYPIVGCNDPTAVNYNSMVNTPDSSCYYSAGCNVGDIYYIPNDCFEWVIDIDDYCCDVEWDNTCIDLYNYCQDGWTGPTNIIEYRSGIKIFPNPVINNININKNVDINVFNYLGDMIISKQNINVLDVSYLIPGIYLIHIIDNEKTYINRIIKQ
tara:strand:- start:5449 stop:7608 length:2160 start_codon:yes stop_codon:yes gene_type:complete